MEQFGDHRGKGNGWEGLSPLGIKIISAWYHGGGPLCKVSRILENTVAKKW